MNEPGQPDWVNDPEQVLFITDTSALPEGVMEEHALGAGIGNLFHRSKEDVKADLAKTFEQMKEFLENLTPSAHGYRANEVTFELGFSAEGKVGFIAQAGITASISVTFTHDGA